MRAFLICLTLSLTAFLFGTPEAVAQRKPKLGQYKRLHQDALRQVLQGDASQAIQDLQAVLEELPNDAESHYMLAVAHASEGDPEAAMQAVRDALDAGMPLSRFTTGTKTGLESLRKTPAFQSLYRERKNENVRLSHGPMLGDVRETSVQVWVRTAGICQVSVIAESVGGDQRVDSETVLTTENADHTAVVRLAGLRANTAYRYRVRVADHNGEQANLHPGGTFTTLVAKGKPIKFRLAFGGGAGFVPQHERMWDTIAAEKPDVLLLLGDNVYSDAPKLPSMQHYCYYRRQSRPEFRKLLASTPTYTIWDDHDFGTNDCSGGPEIDSPTWKRSVFEVFRNNWVNPGYGGGDAQPGCYYDYYLGDVHFVMLDGRYYRNLQDKVMPTMLGPVQREWLKRTIRQSTGKMLVLCSPVPWVFAAKGDSKDTWNGFHEERQEIFDVLHEQKSECVLLISADRHRSDLWKIQREKGYPLYELNSSRLTNQHVHKELPQAVFSYNDKQSFGTVDFDTTSQDPTISYRIISIDGEEVYRHTIHASELRYGDRSAVPQRLE